MNRAQHASILRTFRTVHRTTGSILFVIFFIVSTSGLLLGWKKNSNGLLLPHTRTGTTTDVSRWRPLDELKEIAVNALHQRVNPRLDTDLQRIDARPDNGTVKFVFDDHYWGVQIDGASGDVLQIQRRNHDLIEQIHDGSLADRIIGTEGEIFKLVYTSVTGLSLLLFTVTGFWLWFGPKVMRRASRQGENVQSSSGVG